MTTYRKDIKKDQHLMLKHTDTLSLYQNEVRGYLQHTHSRTNCLVGFTVISILIGSAALAISILLLLQGLDMRQAERIRYDELQMRIKYLEHLTESMEQAGRKQERIPNLNDTPPLPPQPPLLPTALPPSPQSPSPRPPPQLPPQSLPPSQPPVIFETTHKQPIAIEGGDKIQDLYKDLDGNLHIDEEDYGEWEDGREIGLEGSGDGCPPNPPRPICPRGMRICQVKDICPVYVCCRRH